MFCAKLSYFLGHFCCYIQKQYTKQAFCEKRKLSLCVYACFAREWNTKKTSQSKLDPFSCLVHGPKKRPASLPWKGTTSEGKIQAQEHFQQSNQASTESLFSAKKKIGGLGHFNHCFRNLTVSGFPFYVSRDTSQSVLCLKYCWTNLVPKVSPLPAPLERERGDLSSLPPGGGKRRDPGNELTAVALFQGLFIFFSRKYLELQWLKYSELCYYKVSNDCKHLRKQNDQEWTNVRRSTFWYGGAPSLRHLGCQNVPTKEKGKKAMVFS